MLGTGATGAIVDEIGAGSAVLDTGGREDGALVLCVLEEFLEGRTPALPAQTVHGHPMLSPLLSIKY